MTVSKLLAVGDGFISGELITDAIRQEVGDSFEIETLDLPWPLEPFGRVAEVAEASGTEEQIMEAAGDIEVIVTQLAPITERVLEAADTLRLVVCTRGGPVNVNLDAASKHSITVCNAPGRNAPAAAEYTIGLMLAAIRRIPEAHASLSSGDWKGDFYAFEECGLELSGSTCGLVGFGAIGRRVAQGITALGARVLVFDPFVDISEVEAVGGSLVESLDELLGSSRIVSLHARLTDDTSGIIGREEISRVPTGSVLLNTARGGLLDYEALCDALESGHLGAAALDVYEEEPLPKGSRLFDAPRLILSPHIAGATKETAQRGARIAAEEVGRFVRGETLINVTNPETTENSL